MLLVIVLSCLIDGMNCFKVEIADFNQLKSVALPFCSRKSTLYDTATFEYHTEFSLDVEPVYHLRQNHFFLLLLSFQKQWIFFTLKRVAGDCSKVRIHGQKRIRVFEEEPKIPSGLTLEIYPDEIHLILKSLTLKESESLLTSFYLYVPIGCELSVASIERQIHDIKDLNQLLASHENNRPPKLIGLLSNEVHNVGKFTILKTASDFPPLTLESISETKAEFRFESKDEKHFVIPQFHALVMSRLPQDAMKLVFQQKGECFFKDTNDHQWTGQYPNIKLHKMFRSSDFADGWGRLEMELSAVDEPRDIWTFADVQGCEYKLLEITRTMTFRPRDKSSELLKNGVSPDEYSKTTIELNSNIVHAPRDEITWVTSLSCFGEIPYSHQQSKSAVFQTDAKRQFIVVKDTDIDLLIPTELPSASHLIVEKETRNCIVEVYHVFPNGRSIAQANGLVVERNYFRNRVIINFQVHRLRRMIDPQSRIVLTSSCNLNVIQMSVAFKGTSKFGKLMSFYKFNQLH